MSTAFITTGGASKLINTLAESISGHEYILDLEATAVYTSPTQYGTIANLEILKPQYNLQIPTRSEHRFELC